MQSISEEDEVLIDINESRRPTFPRINQSSRNNSFVTVQRNNRLNSQPVLCNQSSFRAPIITRPKSTQTDPPIEGFPASWLVELKSQVDSLHQEMANAYNSFVEYPITNLNEIKALAEHESKHGPVSLVDEQRKRLQLRSGRQQSSWDPLKVYQRPANHEDRLNHQSREQNLRLSLIQMLKSTTKLKSLVSLGLDTEEVAKSTEPTGASMTSITQTEPIDSYVKFLQIIDSAQGAMSSESNSSGDDASHESDSSDDSFIADTILTNIHLRLGGMIQERLNQQGLSDREVPTGQKEYDKNAPSLVNDDCQSSQATANKYGQDIRSGSTQESVKRQSFRNREGAKGSRNRGRSSSNEKDVDDSMSCASEDNEEDFDRQYFGYPEEDRHYPACLNGESTSVNPFHRPVSRKPRKKWGKPFKNIDIMHQLVDVSKYSNIDSGEDTATDVEEHDSRTEYGQRTLDGSTIKLRKKMSADQDSKSNKSKTRQMKYTSKDNLYDLIVDDDESVEFNTINRYNSQKKPGRSQRKLLPGHPVAQSTPLAKEDFGNQKRFSFQDYLSHLKRVHKRKPSTKRTKEIHENKSSVEDFDFEDYYQKITNLHGKYRILKDVITKTPSPQ